MGTTGLPVARDPHNGCRGRKVAAVRGHGAAVGSGPQGGDKEGGEGARQQGRSRGRG